MSEQSYQQSATKHPVFFHPAVTLKGVDEPVVIVELKLGVNAGETAQAKAAVESQGLESAEASQVAAPAESQGEGPTLAEAPVESQGLESAEASQAEAPAELEIDLGEDVEDSEHTIDPALEMEIEIVPAESLESVAVAPRDFSLPPAVADPVPSPLNEEGSAAAPAAPGRPTLPWGNDD